MMNIKIQKIINNCGDMKKKDDKLNCILNEWNCMRNG